jgi:glycosyltransferase involved in cell wall biosynthesis
LVGEGPYRVVIEEKVTQLGLEPWVRLAGFREPVAPWFALMDLVVLASYANEGVPQALLQALAMAKPVVGTTIGGIPEVVLEGETGLLVPPRDPHALTAALDRLRTDPDLCRKLGDRGREVVMERFSLEQMAAEIEAVYNVLAGSREGQGRG